MRLKTMGIKASTSRERSDPIFAGDLAAAKGETRAGQWHAAAPLASSVIILQDGVVSQVYITVAVQV